MFMRNIFINYPNRNYKFYFEHKLNLAQYLIIEQQKKTDNCYLLMRNIQNFKYR